MLSIQTVSNLRQIFGTWIVLLGAVVVLAAYFNVYEAPRPVLEVITTLNWLMLTIVLAKTLPRGIWSISFIFFIVFGVFHNGLILANVVDGITDEDTLYQISFWFNRDETENAIHLINMAFLGFALGVLLISRVPPELSEQVAERETCKRMHHIGGILLLAMVGCFFAITLATGAIYSYGAYLAVIDAVPLVRLIFTYLYLFIGLAIVLVTVSYRKGFGYGYFLVFAVWSLVAFKIGLRGEVMFPSAVAACLLGRKGKPINGLLLALLAVVFLVMSGIVKNARISGDYAADYSLNPMNAVAELGSSLRAVQEVVRWRIAGEPLLLGGSYWAPFERQFALFVPQLERKPVLEDKRLLNVVVDQRAGPIGFSPVAEAYMNFGERGVLVVFLFLGFVMAKLDNMGSRLKTDLLIGVSLVPVFIMIRNSFTHVPVQVVLGISLAFLVWFLANKKRAVE